jgi:DNA repair exonuclease SbcCD nuclease subunit
MKFLHAADVHLGYQQYGSKERFNDFSKAFLHIVSPAARRWQLSWQCGWCY